MIQIAGIEYNADLPKDISATILNFLINNNHPAVTLYTLYAKLTLAIKNGLQSVKMKSFCLRQWQTKQRP